MPLDLPHPIVRNFRAAHDDLEYLSRQFPLAGTLLADDSVEARHIVADAVGSSEIAASAVGSSEIATDAVGADELFTEAKHVVGAAGEPAFQNNWVNFNAFGFGTELGFWKLASGLVVIQGMVSRGAGAYPSDIFTLPAGYWPSESLAFPAISNDVFHRLDVRLDGIVRAQSGNNAYYSLNITFMVP